MSYPSEGLFPAEPEASYTFLELQEEVLSHQFSATKYRDLVKRWLNQAQRRAVIESEIRTQEERYEFETVAGEASYSLPADFGREIDFSNTETQEPFDPVDIKDFDSLTTSSGRPYAYAVVGSALNLYPTPDGAYPLSLRYWRLPTDMTADSDVPEIPVQYQELLIAYAMKKAFLREDDLQMAQVWEAQWEKGILKMRGEVQGDVFDGPRQVGGSFSADYLGSPNVWRG